MHGPIPGRVNNWMIDGQSISLLAVQAATFANDGNLIPLNTSARGANSLTHWKYYAALQKFVEVGPK